MEGRGRSGIGEDELLVTPAVMDSSILYNFVLIGCVDHLVCAFEQLAITPRLRSEMSKHDILASINKHVAVKRIVVLDPTLEENFVAVSIVSRGAYGKSLSETDKEIISIAKSRGLKVLSEDTPMRKVAIEQGIRESDLFNTRECLQKLVDCGRLELEEAKTHFVKINEQRVLHRHPALPWEDDS